jgi:hypothetical protein
MGRFQPRRDLVMGRFGASVTDADELRANWHEAEKELHRLKRALRDIERAKLATPERLREIARAALNRENW